VRRTQEVVDGEYQNYITRGGKYIRDISSKIPLALKLVEHYSDEQLENLTLGGHDPEIVIRLQATRTGAPTVILARTVKGYGLGGR
jgi:pyruvate dehydrogenase E1 component